MSGEKLVEIGISLLKGKGWVLSEEETIVQVCFRESSGESKSSSLNKNVEFSDFIPNNANLSEIVSENIKPGLEVILALRMSPNTQIKRIIEEFNKLVESHINGAGSADNFEKNVSTTFSNLKRLLSSDSIFLENFLSENGLTQVTELSRRLKNQSQRVYDEAVVALLSSLVVFVSALERLQEDIQLQCFLVEKIEQNTPASLMLQIVKILLLFCEVGSKAKILVANTRQFNLFERLCMVMKISNSEFSVANSTNDNDMATFSLRLLNKCMLGEDIENFEAMSQIIEEKEVAIILRDLFKKKTNQTFKDHASFFDQIIAYANNEIKEEDLFPEIRKSLAENNEMPAISKVESSSANLIQPQKNAKKNEKINPLTASHSTKHNVDPSFFSQDNVFETLSSDKNTIKFLADIDQSNVDLTLLNSQLFTKSKVEKKSPTGSTPGAPPLAPRRKKKLIKKKVKEEEPTLEKPIINLRWKSCPSELTTPSGQKINSVWTQLTENITKQLSVNESSLSQSFTKEKKLSEEQENFNNESKILGKATKFVSLLDGKKTNSIGIALSKFPDLNGFLADLDNLNFEKFNAETMDIIIKNLIPTDEEVKLVKNAVDSDPEIKQRLPKPEAFVLRISKVKHLAEKIQIMSFFVEFQSNSEEILKFLQVANTALKYLKLEKEDSSKPEPENKSFFTVLAMLDKVANFIGKYSSSGGFLIDHLAKVADIKDMTKQRNSLIWHVINESDSKFPLKNFFNDEGCQAILECSNIDSNFIKDSLNTLKLGCQNCAQKFETIRREILPQSAMRVGQVLYDYYMQVAALIQYMEIIEVQAKITMMSFGWTAAEISKKRLEEFFQLFRNFISEFNSIYVKYIVAKERHAQLDAKRKLRGKKLLDSSSAETDKTTVKKAIDTKSSEGEKESDQVLENFLHSTKMKSVAKSAPNTEKLSSINNFRIGSNANNSALNGLSLSKNLKSEAPTSVPSSFNRRKFLRTANNKRTRVFD
ncbi:MAG: formin y 2 domain containing [Paramarteilia canceri]